MNYETAKNIHKEFTNYDHDVFIDVFICEDTETIELWVEWGHHERWGGFDHPFTFQELRELSKNDTIFYDTLYDIGDEGGVTSGKIQDAIYEVMEEVLKAI